MAARSAPDSRTHCSIRAPTLRDVAFSAAAVGAQSRVDGAARVYAPRLVFDAAGNLVRFTAPAARGVSTPGDIYDTQAPGNPTTFQSGVDAATQIRWGRWIGGAYSIAFSAGGAGSQSLAAAPLHWIAGPDLAQVTLPVTGTRTYVLAGASAPTDSLAQGNVGTLGGAFLAADFTQRTLSATVTLDIAGANWWATGVGALAPGSNQLVGTFNDVRIDGVTGNAGTWSGFLTATQAGGPTSAGAGIAYTLIDTAGARGSVQGVVALREGTGSPPPAPPPPGDRAVAIAIGAFATAGGSVAFVTAETNPAGQYGVDAGGLLTRFAALTPLSQTDVYGLGTNTQFNTGFDSGTGLRWGRWSGGVPTLPASPAQSLAAQSLHWVLGSSYSGAPVLPVTGTGFLTLVGNTLPTDTRGNVGALGGASFSADFTAGGFTYAVLANIDGRRWYASGAGRFVAGSYEFSAPLPGGNIGNLAPVGGALTGILAVPMAAGPTNLGAAITWTLDSLTQSVGAASGATVFSSAGSGFPTGGGSPLTPPALQRRDIGYSWGASGRSFSAVGNAMADYDLAGFDLARFRASVLPRLASVPIDGEFTLGDAQNTDTGFDLRGMLRWGRWAGGTGGVEFPPGGGNPSPADYAARNLHWIVSADSASAPVLPTSGTATYTRIGNTLPTNQANEAGVLNTATFSANFTNATVTTSIGATFSNATWTATGTGTITGGSNLFSGTLSGTFTDTQFNFSQPAFGNFNGFFTGPQDAAGIPNGVGLSFDMTEGQSQSALNGVAAFVARP
jgi:hypothetical protein